MRVSALYTLVVTYMSMNSITKYSAASAVALALMSVAPGAFAHGLAVEAGASVSVGAPAEIQLRSESKVRATTTQDKARERGEKEIERRVENLNKMIFRIGEMKRLTLSDKSALSADLQVQIDALAALKLKLAGSATTTLKADLKSITDSHRIFALIMPKTAILASVDRIHVLVNQMETLGTKFETLIANASTTANVSTAQTALADYKTKVANAEIQADAAASLVANLKPDNGDKNVQKANLQALKDAKAKIQLAHRNLVAARKDINTIRKSLKGEIEIHASSTVRAN